MARRLLRWPGPPPKTVPRHPYRDTALFHGALAVLIVVIAWASGSNVGKSLVIAGAYFVAATLWSWWRFRERVRRLDASEEEL
jgi:drug/metabolite transporter (DMT)-like permease